MRSFLPPLLFALFSCSPEASSTSASASSTASGLPAATASVARTSAPAPPEHTGPITGADLARAKELLAKPTPTPDVYPKLLGLVGKPTKSFKTKHPMVGKDRDNFRWATKTGTTCIALFAVEQPNTIAGYPSTLVEDIGGGTFAMPAKLPARDDAASASAWQAYATCLALLDETPGLPVDLPGSKGPAALVTAADLQKGRADAPSLWIGKTVTTEGTLSFSGENDARVDASGEPILCRWKAGATRPEGCDTKKCRVSGTVQDTRVADDIGYDLIDCVKR